MNPKSILVMFAVSSLLLAGCATERTSHGQVSAKPANLLKHRADTQRAERTGLNEHARQNAVIALPVYIDVIEEAAGAERPW